MPKVEAKQVVVQEIKEKVDKAASIVLVSSRGLTVEQDTNLRRNLRKAGVDYKVYKNTMINFAIEGSKFEDLKQFLSGPTAVAFSYDDPVVAAKLISKELKGMPKLEFKGGVIDGTLYDAKGMVVIANIPPKEELYSKLLGSFKSPLSSFARVIQAIADKDGGTAAEPIAAEQPAAE